MEMIEIDARPHDLFKFPERVTALSPPRLVWRQVAADDVWTCVSGRPGRSSDRAEVLATTRVYSWIDHRSLAKVGICTRSVN